VTHPRHAADCEPGGYDKPRSRLPRWRNGGQTSAPHTEQVSTAARLRDWQDAWHDGDETPDAFRAALLDDPLVLVLSIHDVREPAGSVVPYCGAGVVGLSNLFAVGGRDVADIWSAAATHHFPGRTLVGYERGDDLVPALAGGFAVLGPLHVWVRR
jgi:hypothetical protein